LIDVFSSGLQWSRIIGIGISRFQDDSGLSVANTSYMSDRSHISFNENWNSGFFGQIHSVFSVSDGVQDYSDCIVRRQEALRLGWYVDVFLAETSALLFQYLAHFDP
jgi:hypothetical protein